MITSIFSKSKPINFLIVFFISLLAFFVAILKFDETELTASYIVKLNLVFLSCYFSILLTDFIVSKNYLSQKSNYEVFFFSLFLLLFPKVFLHIDIVLANLFLLLAIRRLLSLRSQKELVKKLYDAALFIGIATLFYFWAILFFVIILVTLFFHSKNKIEHWFVPVLGIITVALIASACSVIFNNDFFSILNITPEISLDYSYYNSTQYIVAITLLFSFGIWSSVYYLKAIKKKKKVLRATYRIVFATSCIAFLVLLLSPEKDGSEFLFLFTPLAIIITNYAEMIKEKWFKEVFILIIVITPFILLML